MLKFRCNYFVILRRFCSTEAEKPEINAVRVRFAPSPTGYLHLGGLRTIVYNYLFARSKNGRFILRIEDTDRRRIVPDAVQNLLSTLDWLNLRPDEGPGHLGGDFGPYFQSERVDSYRKEAERLLEMGHAYKCFCSEDRLMMLRNEALKNRQIVKYDNKCRHLEPDEVENKLKSGQSYCIRFKLEPKMASFNDLVHGEYEFNPDNSDGDFVIIKSDGFPTYHFANVVDDHYMQISHVMRGEEWLTSTPKHYALYDALNWEPPLFAHLPLMMGLKGEKLSKRNDAAFVDYYKQNGYYPLALINSVCSTGRGFKEKEKEKLYEIEELVEKFDINLIGRQHTRFEPTWLDFYNKEVMKKFQDLKPLVEQMRELIRRKYEQNFNNFNSQNNVNLTELPEFLNICDEKYIEKCLIYAKNRISSLNQLFEKDLACLWSIPDSTLDCFKRVAGTGQSDLSKAVNVLRLVRNSLEPKKDSLDPTRGGAKENNPSDDSFSDENFIIAEISPRLKAICEESGTKFAHFMKILRAAVCGCTVGPPVAEMFELLGRQTVVKRLDYVLDKIKADENQENLEKFHEKLSEKV